MSSSSLPHIILIIMDSVSAKRCSAYGHHRDTTPGLTRIAQEGTLYQNCFAPAPWTIPSHASLFSGLFASEHGCDEKSLRLPQTLYSMPEILQQLGYRTVAISSNGLFDFQQGFGVFYEMDTFFTGERYHEARMATKFLVKSTSNELERLKIIINYMRENRYYSFPVVNILDRLYRKYHVNIYEKSYNATVKSLQISKQLINKYKNKQPLFIFMNLMETHMKYNPPANYNNFATISQKEKKELLKIDALEYYIKKITASQLEKLTLLYEQELFYLDEKLLDLYLFIDKVGLKDQTLFIITADHGEMLGEHGLLGHYFGLYNELLHIPLIIKYPASVGQQGECGQLAQLHDLFATIMEITEVPIPVPESSKSLLSTTRNFVFAEHFNPWLGLEACQRRDPNFQPTPTMQPCRCIIDRHLHKLIEWADGRLEFYDLQNDYAEEANLISHSARATQAEQLQQKLQGTLGPFDVSQSLL